MDHGSQLSGGGTISLDGYGAGLDQDIEHPVGEITRILTSCFFRRHPGWPTFPSSSWGLFDRREGRGFHGQP